MPLITAVLKPEEFNAVTLANLLLQCHVGGLLYLPEDTRARTIFLDQVQAVLDQLVLRGILGTEQT
jgi:hypothetical protein